MGNSQTIKSEHQSNTSLQVLGLNEAQSHAELEAGKEWRNRRTVSKKEWGTLLWQKTGRNGEPAVEGDEEGKGETLSQTEKKARHVSECL